MNSNNPFTRLSFITALLLSLCFVLVACGKEPANTAWDSSEKTTIETTSFTSPSSAVETDRLISQEETTTQVLGESRSFAIDFSNLEYGEEVVSFNEQQQGYGYFHISRRMRTAMVNGRTYCFELSLSEADCTERIRFTEEYLVQAGITKEFRICLYDSVKHTYIKDGSLYGPMSAMSDTESLAAVLLAAFGEFANYGMAYGYAGYLLNVKTREAQYPQDWDYYDLNYLCFLPQFGSEEEVENTKAVAFDFANMYISQNGHAAYQDLLEKSGQLETAEIAREALADHYKSQGVEAELSPLLYAMGGTTYSHILKCEYATFYTEQDWAELHQSYYGDMDDEGNDLLYDLYHCTTSYKSHRNVYEKFRLEMRGLQEFFDLYPYNDHLEVFLINDGKINEKYGGLYSDYVNKIYLTHVCSYTHEYIHAITFQYLRKEQEWVIEGLTTYYSLRFPNYNLTFHDYSFRLNIPKMTGGFKDAAQSWLGSQEGQLDIIDYFGLWTYWSGETVYDDPYDIGSAFIDYLVKRFGEREVLDYFLDHHDLSRLTDKSMEELMAEWKNYLEERFKDYGKAGDPI